MAKKRRRKLFKFWLNISSREDRILSEKLEFLKSERGFTQAIRDGVRLIADLSQGNTDVLFEMFPAIRDKLYHQMEADVLERMNIQQSEDVIHHLIELKGVVSQIKNQPMIGAPVQGTVTVRQMIHQENTIEVTQSAPDTSINYSANFIRSVVGATGVMLPVEDEKPEITGQPKQLTVKQIEAPVFDDDDDDDLFNIAEAGD